MLKKISDFYQTAVVNDLQCVAYAYRPISIEQDSAIPPLDTATPQIITLPNRVVDEDDKDGDKSSGSDKPSGPSTHRDDDTHSIDDEIERRLRARERSRAMSANHMPDPVNIVIQIGDASDTEEDSRQPGTSIEDSGVSATKMDTAPLQRWRKLREMELSEDPESVTALEAPMNETEFCKDAIQGQIFLGMTTLAHQPKTVCFLRTCMYVIRVS